MGNKITNLIPSTMSLVGFFLVACILAGCGDTTAFVVIEGPTHLLAKPDTEDTHGNKVVATLKKGEKGKIIHIRYSKSFMFYKIKVDDGRTGYVMYGDKFKVVKEENK
jgi:hypothetical protein